MAIIVPAHDEESGIADTVASLVAELGPHDRLIVVADNCTDETAARAREGARGGSVTVLERRDPERRGKGFALAYGLRALDEDPPPVVLVVDADCRVTKGALRDLAALALTSGRPVQAEYLLTPPPSPHPTALVSAVALLLKNRVRPLGLQALGLPCHLTGSGMAFPWALFRKAPETGSNLVEDLVMGLDMALMGRPPLFCPGVHIRSELPVGSRAGRGQRTRWEHGVLHTARSYVPRLLGAALSQRRLPLAALAFDLLVPPLALLVLLQIVGVAATAVLHWATGLWGPLALAAASMGAVGTAVLVAWIGFAGPELPLRYALYVPFYVAWKIPLYLTLAIRGKQRTWERTARRSS
jgi:glycosyltransferase involved in cell wall biosynthesis